MKNSRGLLKFLFGWRLIFALIYLVGFAVVKNTDAGTKIAESGKENISAAVSTENVRSEKNARHIFDNVTVIESDSFEAEIAALIDEMYNGYLDK